MKLYGSQASIGKSSIYAVFGSGFSQVLLVFAAPVLTRLYSPEDFGLFSVYMAVVAIASITVFMKYELAIPLSNSLSDTVSILKLCFMLGGLFVGVTSLFGMLLSTYLIKATGDYIFVQLYWFVPISAFSVGLLTLFRYWLIKAGRFDLIALSRITTTVLLIMLQLFGGWLGYGALMLVSSYLVANLGISAVMLSTFFKAHFLATRRLGFRRLKRVASRYSKFPRYIVLSDGFFSVGAQLAPLFIATFFSVGDAGLFALAQRIGLAPVSIVAESAGKVFMSLSLRIRGHVAFPAFVRVTLVMLMRTAGVPFMIMAVYAFDAVSLIFGSSWGVSGSYLSLLTPAMASIFICLPLMTLFLVLEMQRMELRFQVLILLLRALGLYIGFLASDIMLTILMFSVFSAVGYASTSVWIMLAAGCKPRSLLIDFLFESAISLILVSPTILWFHLSSWRAVDEPSFFSVLTMILMIVTFVIYCARLVNGYRALAAFGSTQLTGVAHEVE